MTLWETYELLILALPLLLLIIISILLVLYLYIRRRKYKNFIRKYPLPHKDKRKSDEYHLLVLEFYMTRYSENQNQISHMKFKLEMEELRLTDDMLIKNVTTILNPVVSAMAALIAISISLERNADYSSGIISMSGFLSFSFGASWIDMVRTNHLEAVRIRLKYINQAIVNCEKRK